jgi:hypothetical protein
MDFLETLPATQWPGHILAVMLYPDDGLARNQLLTRLKAEQFKGRAAEIPPDAVETLIDAPALSNLMSHQRQDKGILAGEILYTVAIIANTKDQCGAPLLGSVAKAKALIDREALRAGNGRKIVTNRDALSRAWATHRSVSHLWAAWSVFPQLTGQAWAFSDVEMFLLISEYFRRFGERYVTGRRGDRVLSPGEAWSPRHDHLKQEISITVPELSDKALQIIREYAGDIREDRRGRIR